MEPGWQPLFNGNDLTGWKLDGGTPGAWRVDRSNQAIAIMEQKQQSWLLTEREYANFRLRFDFQLGGGARSGVALRVTPKAAKRLVVSIMDDTAPQWTNAQPTQRTGALLDLAIDKPAQLRRVGEWNRMEIELQGGLLQVKVNGNPTIQRPLYSDVVSKYLGARLPSKGLIGLNHYFGSLRFKNVGLHELPASTVQGKPATTDQGKPATTDQGKPVVKEPPPPITPGAGASL
jgi:hypothetical protein